MQIIRKILKFVIVLALVAGAALVAGYFLVKNRVISINRYFLPENPVLGVDVSAYQGEVNMNLLADQGVDFVYIKATEGSSHADERFQENWLKAEKSPLCYGAYHFFSFDSPGESQAQNFIATVGTAGDDDILIPAVDVEYYADKKENQPRKDELVNELKVFLHTVEEYYGVKPLVYSGKEIYDKYLKDDFKDYPHWASNFYFPIYLDFGRDWLVWQYDNKGKLDGHSDGQGDIDLNVLNSTKALNDLRIAERDS